MPLTAKQTARFLLALSFAAVWPAVAQTQTPTWDTSGNGMLKGTYYFRQVYYQIGANDGSLGYAAAAYGVVTFSGTGSFASPGSAVTYVDSQYGTQPGQPYAGVYSIAA